MTNKNLIEEIQELIQKIKKEYQEGVDFEIPYWAEPPKNKSRVGAIHCLSPNLRKFCREWFNIPAGVYDYLDYHKKSQRGNKHDSYYYRVEERDEQHYQFEGLYWHEGSSYEIKQQEPKNCAVCGKLSLEENGRFWVWDKKTIGKEWSQDSKIIAYLHPKCAKKYFANKEQPKENNKRIKEKLLRNLDKLCLDPLGDLANTEVLKNRSYNSDGIYYYRLGDIGGNPHWKTEPEWEEVRKVEVEGEKIDLDRLQGDDFQAIRKALIEEIKQNRNDWKLKKESEGEIVVVNKSGRKHWKEGIREKDWKEIETLINSSKLPDKNNEPNNSELENLKKIFQKYNISKIICEGDELFIEYDNKVNSIEKVKVSNQEFQDLLKYCQEHNEPEINRQSLGIGSDNSIVLSQSKPKNNHSLAIGLTIGAFAVILAGGVLIYLRIKKTKKKKKLK